MPTLSVTLTLHVEAFTECGAKTKESLKVVYILESLPNRYSALELAHVCECITGLQHSAHCTVPNRKICLHAIVILGLYQAKMIPRLW